MFLGPIILSTPTNFNMNFVGVGVDIRVDEAVIFGLPETIENLLQEGGRPMRGSDKETDGKHGFAFFFHKGQLGE